MAKKNRTTEDKKVENKKQGALEPSLKDSIRNEEGKIGYVEVPGEIFLVWNGQPWRSRPKKLALLVGLYFLIFLAALFLIPDAGLFLFLVPVLLLGSASAHLVNSQYVITDQGIYWRNFINQMFKPWIEIENFIFEDDMAELFFDKGSVRSRIQRNMPLYYDDNRQAVEVYVRKFHDLAWADRKAAEEKIRAQVIAEMDKEKEE